MHRPDRRTATLQKESLYIKRRAKDKLYTEAKFKMTTTYHLLGPWLPWCKQIKKKKQNVRQVAIGVQDGHLTCSKKAA